MINYIVNYDDYLISPDIMINDVSYNTALKLIKELKYKYPIMNIDYALSKNIRQDEYRRGAENLVYRTICYENGYEFEIKYSIDNIVENCKITSVKFYDCYNFLKLFCELYDNLIKIDYIIRDYCWYIISKYDDMQERSNESLRGITVDYRNKEQYDMCVDIIFSGNIYKRKHEEIMHRIKENKEIYNNIENMNTRNKKIREELMIINKGGSIRVDQECSINSNIKYLYNI